MSVSVSGFTILFMFQNFQNFPFLSHNHVNVQLSKRKKRQIRISGFERMGWNTHMRTFCLSLSHCALAPPHHSHLILIIHLDVSIFCTLSFFASMFYSSILHNIPRDVTTRLNSLLFYFHASSSDSCAAVNYRLILMHSI